ncbi:hypothetical protein B0H14DRAFT_2575225 [Mycena olivaceomarginata]|nr:hypothetical protein B0H14DRAFT_2575225 [Mycena olivaceomarginata]
MSLTVAVPFPCYTDTCWLASKTNPSANGVRKGKGKEKEIDNAGTKPRKKKRRVANQPEKVIEPGREPSDRPNAAKAAKSPAKRKANPIRQFFTVVENQDADDNNKSYRCNLGNKKVIMLTGCSKRQSEQYVAFYG